MALFDDIVQGINREINRVQSRGQEMMQTYQLNSQIRSVEGKKTATFIEIGRLVYEKYQRASDVSEETLKQLSKEIAGCDIELNALKSELESTKAQYDQTKSTSERADAKAGYHASAGFQCPHCQAPAASGKSFCPSCGGSLGDSDHNSRNDHSDEPGKPN